MGLRQALPAMVLVASMGGEIGHADAEPSKTAQCEAIVAGIERQNLETVRALTADIAKRMGATAERARICVDSAVDLSIAGNPARQSEILAYYVSNCIHGRDEVKPIVEEVPGNCEERKQRAGVRMHNLGRLAPTVNRKKWPANGRSAGAQLSPFQTAEMDAMEREMDGRNRVLSAVKLRIMDEEDGEEAEAVKGVRGKRGQKSARGR